jgi:hypothetical protein
VPCNPTTPRAIPHEGASRTPSGANRWSLPLQFAVRTRRRSSPPPLRRANPRGCFTTSASRGPTPASGARARREAARHDANACALAAEMATGPRRQRTLHPRSQGAGGMTSTATLSGRHAAPPAGARRRPRWRGTARGRFSPWRTAPCASAGPTRRRRPSPCGTSSASTCAPTSLTSSWTLTRASWLQRSTRVPPRPASGAPAGARPGRRALVALDHTLRVTWHPTRASPPGDLGCGDLQRAAGNVEPRRRRRRQVSGSFMRGGQPGTTLACDNQTPLFAGGFG